MQNVAKATYRAILEQRAKENGVDFVNGVATAITPMAFYETVLAKGYETLVDPATKVDVSTGILAAGRLQALIDSRAGKTNMADILYKMNRIINAVHDTVPQELWPEILHKIGGPIAADTPMDEFDECDDAEAVYDPMESVEVGEDCWTQCAGTRQFHRRGPEGVTITEKVHESAHRAIRTFTPPTKTDEDDGF